VNVVTFWRAMKLLSRMQQAENRERRESDAHARLVSPDSDDRVACRVKPTTVDCDEPRHP
jgi:hypothetical protein